MAESTPVPEVGSKVRLLADIYDDGDDNHHPPGYIARKGEIVIVKDVNVRGLGVAHDESRKSSFAIYLGEWGPVSD